MAFTEPLQAGLRFDAPQCPLITAELEHRRRFRVIAKTYANKEIRVYTVGNVSQPSQSQLEALKRARAVATANNLVYKHELQSSDGGAPPLVKLGRRTKLTRHARHVLKEAAGVVEDEYGRNVAFITLTLPGSTACAIKQIAMLSREMQNGFLQRLRDHLRRNESLSELQYFLVWEWQKRGALHVHIGIALSDGVWEALTTRRRDSKLENYHHWWCQIMAHLSDKHGVDMFAREGGGTWKYDWKSVRVSCERVRKSIGRYLSKYVSKGSGCEEENELFHPHRWWSLSKTLREKVFNRRDAIEVSSADYQTATGEVAELGAIMSQDSDVMFSMVHPVSGEHMGYIAYYAGEMHQERWREIRAKLEGVG